MRGINVGGHRVTNDALRSCFEAMGFRDVSAFRASGNVVFAAGDEPLTELTARIEQGLAASLGYEVATFLRTSSEVRSIAQQEPFGRPTALASGGKLQVALLSTRPAARALGEVLALATNEDRLAFGDRELYWLPSGGFSDSTLDRTAISGLLGPMTFRTKNTVEQIARKYFAD